MSDRTFEVTMTDDAAGALQACEPLLATSPVDHNVIASVLTDSIPHPGVGRCWWATDGTRVVAAAIQMPQGHRVTLGPGPPEAIDALADAIASSDPDAPGVQGEAAATSRFAGRWAETRRIRVEPVEAQRLYRLGELIAPAPVAGELRLAAAADEGLIVDWARGFQAETGDEGEAFLAATRRRLAAGRVWLWEDGEPVAMASAPTAIYGVARVGVVYTPPERRSRGYAANVVAALSGQLLAEEADTCILYTQPSNPTSNAVYQRLGYEAVAEILSYRFG